MDRERERRHNSLANFFEVPQGLSDGLDIELALWAVTNSSSCDLPIPLNSTVMVNTIY